MTKGTIRQCLRNLGCRVKRNTHTEGARDGARHISFVEPQPSSSIYSSCRLRRVPNPFPVRRDNHLSGSFEAGTGRVTLAARQPSGEGRNWRPGHVSFVERLPTRPREGRPNNGLTRVPTPMPLRQTDSHHDNNSLLGGGNNGICTMDTRRHAWYGPPVDLFPNVRRH